MGTLQEFYNANELAELNLKCLPSSSRRIFEKAKRENWKSQKRQGRGGGLEYELISMPEAVQTEIRDRFAVAVVNKKPSLPVVRDVDLSSLTNKQRQIADARMALVAAVSQLEQSMSRIKAVTYLCESAKCGQLSADLMDLVETANAKNGNGCGRVLSVRTLNQWVIDYHKADNAEDRLKALAPSQRQAKKAEELQWLPEFLAVYRNTNGVNIAEAYNEFAARWQVAFADQPLRLAQLPSLSTVRRGLEKLPKLIKEIGRKTGAEIRAMNTYVKRDWSVLKANDVWVGDGHSMKMKVAHPEHGRPFIPEVTLVMDAASRFIVGWSVSLAENCLAVADAIRHGVERHGIPAIYYSDNGGGEKNWMLDGDITGMLPRLGINHQTGIFRATFQDEARIQGAIAFRVNNSNDNYTRYCNSPSAVRDWLGFYNEVDTHVSYQGIGNFTVYKFTDGRMIQIYKHQYSNTNPYSHNKTYYATYPIAFTSSPNVWLQVRTTGSKESYAAGDRHAVVSKDTSNTRLAFFNYDPGSEQISFEVTALIMGRWK